MNQQKPLFLPAEAARLPEGRAAYYGLDKTESFDDFKKKYMKAAIEISEADKTKIADVTNKIDFTLAKDIKEAEEYAKQFVDDKQFGALGVSYSGISDESANAVNEALEKYFPHTTSTNWVVYMSQRAILSLGRLLMMQLPHIMYQEIHW